MYLVCSISWSAVYLLPRYYEWSYRLPRLYELVQPREERQIQTHFRGFNFANFELENCVGTLGRIEEPFKRAANLFFFLLGGVLAISLKFQPGIWPKYSRFVRENEKKKLPSRMVHAWIEDLDKRVPNRGSKFTILGLKSKNKLAPEIRIFVSLIVIC